MSMPSEELQLLIAGYVLGDLSSEEAEAFERLLTQDAEIAAEVARMQTALEVTYAAPEVQPPEHLRSTLLNQAEKVTGIINSEISSKPRKRLALRGWGEVAAAVLIVALGANNYRLWQALQTSQTETERYKALTYVLESTQKGNSATAKVVVNPNNLEATIVVQNLPPLPAGKVYALWTVVDSNAPFTTDNKKAILTEVFQVDDGGNFTQTIAVPKAFRLQELVTKVAITIENANAPQQHVGKPILITGS